MDKIEIKNQMEKLIRRKDMFNVVNHFAKQGYSQDIEESAINKVIDTYIDQKLHLFELFGNQLSKSVTIDTQVDYYTANNLIYEMMEEVALEGMWTYLPLLFLSQFCEKEEIVSNIVSKDVHFLSQTFPKGVKVSKVLSTLVPKDKIDKIQTIYSMFLQKTKIRGKLVLSIDPLDFATVSSNASNWGSCHRLNGGEFAAGPLSYLTDSVTMIGYIQSSTDLNIYENGLIKCTNKSWRQLVVINPDHTYAIQEREYPDTNSLASEALGKMVADLLVKDNQYQRIVVDTNTAGQMHTDFYLDHINSNSLHYNDIREGMMSQCNVIIPTSILEQPNPIKRDSRVGSAILNWINTQGIEKPLKGSAVHCLSCGEVTLYHAETLFCSDCCGYDDY